METIPTIDIFGALEFWRRRKPITEIVNIVEGKNPLAPGEPRWGFPFFRPASGPTAGPSGSGPVNRGFPHAVTQPNFVGVFVGPPKS